MKKIFIVTVVVVGMLLALQIRSFQKVQFLIQRSGPGDILAQLRTFQLANEQLRAQLAEEEASLQDISSKITKEAVDDEIKRLRLLAGEDAVTGEGIELTFNNVVPEFWISDLVAQLVGAGAEAVSLNDMRLVSYNAGLRTVNSGIAMHQSFLRAPLRISVIGPQKELHQIVAQSGGIIDKMESAYPGLVILVSPKEKVVIPAVPKI